MRQAIIELLPTNYIGMPMAAIASSNRRLKLFHNADRFIGMECVDPPIESPRSRQLGMQAHRVKTRYSF
jgi:hypothetical protein